MHDSGGSPVNLTEFTNPTAALDDVAGLFFGPQLAIDGRPVDARDVPEPFRTLLVHHEHMTTSLERYHGGEIAVEVIEEQIEGDRYTRKILLCPAGTAHVVEVGVARINLRYTSPAVREEILKRESPLGDILIRHEVLRRIEPKWFFRFEGPASLLAAFDRPIVEAVYGRVGVIYCDGQPAIELLEVVSSEKMNS